MKPNHWLIVYIDLFIMFSIITWAEESTQAAMITIIAASCIIFELKVRVGAYLQKGEDEMNSRPL